MTAQEREALTLQTFRYLMMNVFSINGPKNPMNATDLMAIATSVVYAVMVLNETEFGHSRRQITEMLEVTINNIYANLGAPQPS